MSKQPFGFPDMTQWEKQNPGNIEFCCEYCGIYTASEPRCNKCEGDSPVASSGKTYEDLLNALQAMPKERLKDNISIKVLDDFLELEVVDFYFSTEKDNDVLDEGHLVLHVAE